MKLLVVSTWLPYPPDNGSRVRALHLLQHLSRRHRLTLLSFGTVRAADDLNLLRAFCEHVDVVPLPMPRGNHLGFRGLFSPVPRYYAQTESPEMRVLVAAQIGRHDAAVGLQVDAARYLADHAGVPRIFEEAEVAVLRDRRLRELSPLRSWRHGMTWWKHRRYVRRLVDMFDATTVVSDQEREHLGAIGCDVERVTVVPNGVAAPAMEKPVRQPDRLIYPGSVMYSANLDAVRYFIFDVFPRLRARRPDLEFWVTGSTDGVDIGDLAATDGVVFTGRLPEVDSLVAGSAACVVPLRIGGGTRLKVLQAMALGTPVVSTSKGIEGLDAEPGRHVLVGDSPQAFADQVLRVLQDVELGRRLAGAAEDLVADRYAWGPIGDALERVIEEATERHRSRQGRPA